MSDEATGTGTTASTGQESATSGSTTTTTAAATQTESVEIKLTPAQMKQRLDESRDKARSDIFKELGVNSLADAKKTFSAFADYQKSQMTEQEKLAKERDDLRPKAEAAEKWRAKYATAVERDFNRLPDNVREAIDEQAKGDPEAREMLIGMFAKVGATASTTATSEADPNAVAKPANAGASKPAPKSAAVQSKFEQFEEMKKSRPAMAGAFYYTHQLEIERTRPAT